MDIILLIILHVHFNQFLLFKKVFYNQIQSL